MSIKHVISSSAVALVLVDGQLVADIREELGYNELLAWSDNSLPSTEVIRAGLVEASASGSEAVYTPREGTNETSGKTFTVVGATPPVSSSGHASTVAANYFGNVSSIAPEINTIDVLFADDFINTFLTRSVLSDGASAVGLTDVDVMNHSYVSNPSNQDASTKVVTRFDFLTQESSVLNVVGLNNGAGTSVPAIWGESYNSISVGLSSANHSSGDTRIDSSVATGLVAGRQKPEIVVPQSLTSWATASVSSAGSLLIAKARDMGNANGELPIVTKSILMAGASKEGVTSWSNSPTRPLDDTFGAGELNIFHSYRILAAGEQSSGAVDLRGWAKQSVNSGSVQTFQITVPDYSGEASLSANLTWERNVVSTISGPFFSRNYSYAYETLENLNLTLKDSSNTIVASSNSAVDNNEHIWSQNLSPGTYTLEVSSLGNINTDYCLAWRTEVTPKHNVAHGDFELNYSSMVPSYDYSLLSSSDMKSWTEIEAFTSSSTGTYSYTDPTPTEQRFFRLEYFLP